MEGIKYKSLLDFAGWFFQLVAQKRMQSISNLPILSSYYLCCLLIIIKRLYIDSGGEQQK